MKVFRRQKEHLLNSNLQLHADDTLHIGLFYDVSQHMWITTEAVDEACNRIDEVIESVFQPGLTGARIRILDLYSVELEKKIDKLERKIAKLEWKSSILRLLGFNRRVDLYEE